MLYEYIINSLFTESIAKTKAQVANLSLLVDFRAAIYRK